MTVTKGLLTKLCLLLSLGLSAKCATNYTFASDFQFGAGTASYQVEGAWNEDGKGENIWDALTHQFPDFVREQGNGDVACDSYHKYKEDVSLLENLGVDFYRFSVSWARIFPAGDPYVGVNPEGLAYYNNLINALVEKNIAPMLTIYHWDLPQKLQLLGGWTNPLIVTWYTEYAKVLLDNFADRVKFWFTFNEPHLICQGGYGDTFKAPIVNLSGTADYLCSRYLLKAHASVYHLFNDTYRAKNNATIGLAFSAHWMEPNTTNDEEAAERINQFRVGLYANPIFIGDYPDMVKQRIANRSLIEGRSRSRLPTFTNEEIKYIKGTADFFAVNHYTTYLVADAPTTSTETSFLNDEQVSIWFDPNWPVDGANRWRTVPWGFRKLLLWIQKTYNNPEIYVTESGCTDRGEIEDYKRVSYHGQYLETLLQTINEDKVKVTHYSVWSLLDNLSWNFGYTYKFGLYHVNFTDPERTRRPKLSTTFYKNVIATRTVGNFTIV